MTQMRIKNAVILFSGLALILSLPACKQPEEKTGGNAQKAQVEVPAAPTTPEKSVQEEPIQVQEPDNIPAEDAEGEEPAEGLPPLPTADGTTQEQVELPQLQPAEQPVLPSEAEQQTVDKAQVPVQEEPAPVMEQEKKQEQVAPPAGGIDTSKLEGKDGKKVD
jgi:hypothetical protein